jgi:hypothetical protein
MRWLCVIGLYWYEYMSCDFLVGYRYRCTRCGKCSP